jgi:hypothetical protein
MCAGTANQGVTAPEAGVTARALGEPQVSLVSWYGEPLDTGDAEHLYTQTEKALMHRLRAGLPVFQLQVIQLLCHYWMDVSILLEYRQLMAIATGKRDRALLELVYGQLLLSRRRTPALQHLDCGFRLAAGYLEARDYFLLVRRHDLLRYLPLSAAGVAPQGLQSLLAEAAVISQLQGARRHTCSVSHSDTLG